MLARHATRGTQHIVLLDFLAPRVLRRANGTNAAFSKSPQFDSPHLATNDTSPVPPAPLSASSEHYSRLSPRQLIDRLDRQLQHFQGGAVAELTGSQVDVFNRAVSVLQDAARHSNWRKARTVWHSLKQQDLLRFLGPLHYDMYSRIVAVVCQKHPVSESWSPQEQEALDEIAVAVAVSGATMGLKHYMFSFITRGDADAVLRLYERYRAQLGDKVSWANAEQNSEADENGVGSSRQGSSQHVAANLVRGDVLLCAVTAYAMQDNFEGALLLAVQTMSRFSDDTLTEFLNILKDDPKLRRKVEDFARRLEVARLVSRPAALSRHIANLIRDNALTSLQKTYNGILAGLTGPDAWMTLKEDEKSAQKPVVVPEFIWPSFLTGFLRCRDTTFAEKLWDDALKLGVRPPISMWTALIDGYANMKAVNEAINSWDIMRTQGVKPDAMTYRAIIYALYHSGHMDEALKRFHAFQKDLPNISPPPLESEVLVVYNSAIHGLLFHFRDSEAREILDGMLAKGPKPDIVTFNTFIRYYGRAGKLKTLASMLQMLESAGVVGDVFTFSTVLSALLKVRDDAPRIVLNLMEKQGVKPNTATLTAIIDHQVKEQSEKALQTAMELLEKMERSVDPQAQPNEITYTSILTGIHRGTWLDRKVAREYRRTIWQKIDARGIKPVRTTFNTLIMACFDNPGAEGVQDAMQYYRDMLQRRVFPANDTWFILLHGLYKREEWALLQELVADLDNSGFTPAKAMVNAYECQCDGVGLRSPKKNALLRPSLR